MEANNYGRWPPKKNEMPDLNGLDGKLVLNQMLNAVFRKAGPKERLARGLWFNYVRLVDQTIWEYNAARESLQKYIDTPNNEFSPSFLFRTSAHLETCINTIRRAIRFARRMRRHQHSPSISKLPVLSDSVGKRIDGIRNAVEHLEEEILNGKIGEGEPTTLIVKSDSIELANIEIFYSELADWIKELHELAVSMADYREEDVAT